MSKSNNSTSGEPDPIAQAMQAWQLAWSEMAASGARALKSNAYIAAKRNADVTIADAPAETVFRSDKVRVDHYEPVAEIRTDIPPVLICYGLFGRQTMIDLQDDRSLVRTLLAAGVDVYVVDWGTPTRADRFLTFDDYVDRYLLECVEHVVGANEGKPINLFGICEGGTFAVMLAAIRPELLSGLALAITPVDFHGKPDEFWEGEGFLNSWIANLDEADVDRLIDVHGNLPGALTGAVFSSLTPMASMTKYNLGLAAMDGDPKALDNFLRMEKWIADRPDHPGEAARQWLNGLYRENRLVKGTFEICGEPVDLTNIAVPVINIFALRDHIIPVSCSKALGEFVADDLYEEIGFPGGHVGVFVSGKAQGVVAGGLIDWMERRTKQ
ncbi:MAG: alpha/beta fold hydrolase [Pseudomonadota bacterium]